MQEERYDIAIAGGGSAGVAAAVAAARTGMKTILIERQSAFGGAATNAWVSAYCGFYTRGEQPIQVVFGVGEEILQRLKEYGEDINYTISPSTKNASIRFHPEMIKLVLDDLISESAVTARLFTGVIGVNKRGNRIESILLQDDEKTYRVRAKAFIDTTGNGNLLHMAGLSTDWGNEAGEVQQSSLACLLQGIPSHEISMETLTKAIREEKKNLKTSEFLDKERGLIVKVPSDDYGFLTIPSETLSDLTGAEKTCAIMRLRKKARAYTEALRKHAEGFDSARLFATAAEIGIREARRMHGKETVTGEDVLRSQKRENRIAKGGWPAEIHYEKGLHYIETGDNDWFDIPMGALMSRDLENVFAGGRNVSCDSVALASLRVMGTGFATGQAAGVIASVYCRDHEIDVKKVQRILNDQDARI